MLCRMAATSPAPVTLVIGDEELLADRAVGAVVAAAREADPGVETHDLAGGKVEPGELTRLASPSLFGDGSAIVIRSAQDLGKDVIAEVVAYAARPADGVVLVLAHPGGVKGKALVDGVKKAGAQVVTVSKITKPGERLDFVKSEIRRAGRTIAPDAAQALVDAVGSDLRELAAACGQLVFDAPSDRKSIDAAAVARYYRGRAEVSGFTVADAAVEGRLADALEQLRWALGTGVAPVLLVSALAGGLRSLAKVGGAARNARGGQLASQLGMPPWKVDRVRRQLNGWTPDGIARAIQAIADADEQVKGGGADPAYALEHAVQTIVASRSTGR
ncbi:DNA polymerase III subunit delta [Spongiactinospora sp. TRM90649]|uniref:DNA polymerase III subunit delta n=1 Tax=Spongiactinospora sp. TRM90649 TaxID=3031114 RepID=UPI0023F68793|nr:DNA polymerase III subunit delta [Spongiactinospora sp. TRM90649]MDF5754094.1 DNA polymerase III subunit delta [Spongiactinospora sp. TRM90649]